MSKHFEYLLSAKKSGKLFMADCEVIATTSGLHKAGRCSHIWEHTYWDEFPPLRSDGEPMLPGDVAYYFSDDYRHCIRSKRLF